MPAILSAEPTLPYREFQAFRKLIYELAGIVLTDAKQTLVQGRLARRLRELGLTNYSDYLEILTGEKNSPEITPFINALTTNKTDFFREPFHFRYLTEQVLPEIESRGRASGDRKLRIWCAASSTGEEPYSLAMTVREYFGQDTNWDIRILASDIDTNVLATAATGVYPESRVTDIPVVLRHRYFERERTGGEPRWHARPSIRNLLTFRRINLKALEWPIHTLFDVIFCRNVMIYFDRDTQAQLIRHFADYLRPQGLLMVGHSESLHDLTNDFQSLGNTIHRSTRTNVAPPVLAGARQRPRPEPVAPLSEPMADVDRPATPVKDKDRSMAAIRSATSTAPPINSTPIGDAVAESVPIRRIILGEMAASSDPLWISTILGSCVATCLYDEKLKLGGMNHFMLPEVAYDSTKCARFGVHAMELLINQIMKLGGDRRRLKAKIFGGAAVIKMDIAGGNIGLSNVAFAEHFLSVEGIPIVAAYTGGQQGMQVQFNTTTGKARVKLLDASVASRVDREIKVQADHLAAEMADQSKVTLF